MTPTGDPRDNTHPRAAGRPAARLRVGISYGDRLVWMSDRDLTAALDDAVMVGARWVRADLAWRDVQPDGPDGYRWQPFDRVVAAAGARGLNVLAVLAYTPPWARPGGCGSDKCPPADPGAFAAFAASAAHRYAPRGVHTWEIWNEPNLGGFWHPAPDPAAYTALLAAAARALRVADPRARVVLGGLAAVRTGAGRVAQTDFLAAVAARDGHRMVDAVGYHPYTYPYLAGAVTQWGTAWERIGRTDVSLRGVLARYGTPDLPVWVTEYGAPTGGPGHASDGRPSTIDAQTTHVTEAWQAAIAADAVRTAEDTALVDALIWYCERDLSDDRSSNENFYGLRRFDGSAKPALTALRGAVAALGG
ncbi:cellulase family glycosylhydrolase [Streptomyces sp. B1866]|uniref:cellulase family glycosylhydrolase n=1 Tax=Streptomyces sp. B1866 TaxID=3075431 RepID=UPI00289101F4|nr:cellulase family glycosylhydrolase [Streptomyces sp. B1866]MDT3395195.1 cellulase family glycosylhydrolase [Streptomyces sp. B1866]